MSFSGTQGLAELTLRVLDANGVGLQMANVYAVLYNSESEVKDTVDFLIDAPTMQELQDDNGYYYQIDLDTSNPEDWPGSFVRADWTAFYPGSPSPAEQTFSKIYFFYPVTTLTANKTVLSWNPVSLPALRGYTIETMYPEDLDFTYLSFSAYPCFVDETTYTPAQRNRIIYRVMASLWDPDGIPSPLDGDVIGNVDIWQTDQELCMVTGTVTHATSQPDDFPYPRFLVHHPDAPMNIGNQFSIISSEIVAPPNNFGQFAIFLVRGTIVTAEIPSIGYSRKFIVPDQAHVRLADLDSSLVELYRAE